MLRRSYAVPQFLAAGRVPAPTVGRGPRSNLSRKPQFDNSTEMILTVTIAPCIDKSVFIDKLRVGKIIRAQSSKEIAGGKGVNVSRLVNNLGGNTLALVAVAGLYGEKICELINNQDGFPLVPIWISGESRTITTVLDTSKHIQTAYVEPSALLNAKDRKKIMDTYLKYLPESNFVVLSGSIPDGKQSDIFYQMILLAKKKNKRVILDSRGEALKLGVKAKPFMVKPNIEEAGCILSKKLNKLDEYWECVDYCINTGIELVVLTLGKKGALAGYKDKRWQLTPPEIREINPVGSGDALVAGIAVSILDGKNMEYAVKYGLAAAVANASIWDACYSKNKDILRFFDRVKMVKREG